MRLGSPDALWLVIVPGVAILALVYGYLIRRQLTARLGHLPLVQSLTASLSPERRLLLKLLL